MMKWLVATVLVVALAESAATDLIDGNTLYEWGLAYEAMQRSHPTGIYDAGAFAGFVTGAVQAFVLEEGANEAPLICCPDNIKVGQETEVVMKYLREHPEERPKPGANLVWSALLQVFPCPKNAAPSSKPGASPSAPTVKEKR